MEEEPLSLAEIKVLLEAEKQTRPPSPRSSSTPSNTPPSSLGSARRPP